MDKSELIEICKIAQFAGGVQQLSAVGIGRYLRQCSPEVVLALIAENARSTEREILQLAEIEALRKDAVRDQRIQCAMAVAMAEVGEALGIIDQQGGAEEQVQAVKQLNTIIEDLERARIAGFKEYDFTRLKDRKGDQKVFEITIETECGCDIEEGEYTVRVTHLLGNWMGSDDFSLIGDAVAEVVSDLGLPEEGHTTFIAYESGERQDVFWTKWFEIATVASVLAEPDAATGKGERS